MKIMVFDVGGTEIKYSVMDEQMHRTDSGAVPTPQDTQAQFLDAVYRLYAPHKDEVTGIAMALPGFVDNHTGYVSNGGALLYNTATPVGQLLAEKCSCPVILENDGKAAAMAELANGARALDDYISILQTQATAGAASSEADLLAFAKQLKEHKGYGGKDGTERT